MKSIVHAKNSTDVTEPRYSDQSELHGSARKVPQAAWLQLESLS